MRDNQFLVPSSQFPVRGLLVAFAAIVTVIGCDKATGIKAQFPNLEGKVTVYAMNSAAVTLPAALSIRSAAAVRIDATFLFDIAFDLDSTGAVKVFPLSRVANELVGTHRVGMQLSNQSFASLLKAPTGGYIYDSVVTLPLDRTMLVDVLESSCGSSFLGANIRAKIAVDSVNLVSRAIFLHILADPNCGFRGLNQGEPKD